jgi:hypothetical protein
VRDEISQADEAAIEDRPGAPPTPTFAVFRTSKATTAVFTRFRN